MLAPPKDRDPKERARQILKDLHIDDPALLLNLKEICIERGAFVRESHLDASEARLTVRGDHGIITVKPNADYAARTRFSIAHELGHFELHRGIKHTLECDKAALNDFSGKKERSNRESEANVFASELLMPEKFFLPEIRGREPSFGIIERLADKFQTSLFATTRRYIGLTEHSCAAVFFRGTNITSSVKSRGFRARGWWIGTHIDPRSRAGLALGGEGQPPRMDPVPAEAWFKVPRALADEPVLEQTRIFPNLEMGMSLLWIPPRSRLLSKLSG